MRSLQTDGGAIHMRVDGPEDGPAILFSNSLGTDFRVWDKIIPRLPKSLRSIRYDKRGHGLSEVRGRIWGMGDLVADAAAVVEAAGARDVVVVGLSVGGMIAQGLAAERPDLVRGLVLSDTGAKIGAPDMWDERIAAIEAGGIAALSDPIMERWFTAPFRANAPEFPLWRAMLERTTLDGYLGVCAAIRDTDLRESTSLLRIPTLGVCGDKDGSTPPDLVRETTALIPGSRFELIAGAGHLPCVEQPDVLAGLLSDFLESVGHV